GFRVIGPNGNSIFLPAAGYRDNTNTIASETIGRYMSSSLDTVFSSNTCFLSFVSDDVQISSDYRSFGLVIRPVFDN
ncbi:MAG: serine/threonine protein kinase, partial [Paludibacteraceae bacterium]|nr:serine/threonine protein kinase [Paludibacteraceae bacterium]